MTQRQCPLCSEEFVGRPLTIAPYVPNPLSYVQCRRCGLVFAADPPSSQPVRLPLTAEKLAHFRRWKLPINRERVSWLMRRGLVPRGHAADVGTKDGSAVKAQLERGWESLGFDRDQRFHEFARRQYGVEIRPEWFSVDAVGSGALSLVTAYHVLEHIPDPLSWLGEVREALKPEGYLHVETPNLRDIEDRLVNRGHVVLYTVNTLRQLLEKGGFRIVATTEFAPGGNRTYDQLGMLAQRDHPKRPGVGLGQDDLDAPRYLEHPRVDLSPSSVLPVRVYRAVRRRIGVVHRRVRYHVLR